ncbi:hypothetical protein EV1_009760 [Malus domestica]
MGNTEKLMNQIMELKFTSKSLQRQSKKCYKEEKAEKLKIKKAMEKGNVDNAQVYAKMLTINKSMGNIVKSLKSSLAIGNLQKMSETMDSFEK